MSENMSCPRCHSEYAYQDGLLWVCPECAHEWSVNVEETEASDQNNEVRDANGTVLRTGDSVTVIKDLKVKGASAGLKSGTKVKNIRLVDGPDGHNIACKIDGFGAMNLKSEFVRKA